MNKKMDVRDFEEIDRLIQSEVDEALRAFRSWDFVKRLRTRIAADDRPVRAESFLKKAAIPAAATLLLAVSAALFLLDVHRSSGPGPIDPRTFAAVLSQLPSFSRPASVSPPGPAEEAGMFKAGGGFESALASAERRKAKEEGETSVRAGTPRVPALSMKERMEILFRDRVIERALALLTDKSKEA